MTKFESMHRRPELVDGDVIWHGCRKVCGGETKCRQGGVLSSWMKQAQRKRERLIAKHELLREAV